MKYYEPKPLSQAVKPRKPKEGADSIAAPAHAAAERTRRANSAQTHVAPRRSLAPRRSRS